MLPDKEDSTQRLRMSNSAQGTVGTGSNRSVASAPPLMSELQLRQASSESMEVSHSSDKLLTIQLTAFVAKQTTTNSLEVSLLESYCDRRISAELTRPS